MFFGAVAGLYSSITSKVKLNEVAHEHKDKRINNLEGLSSKLAENVNQLTIGHRDQETRLDYFEKTLALVAKNQSEMATQITHLTKEIEVYIRGDRRKRDD